MFSERPVIPGQREHMIIPGQQNLQDQLNQVQPVLEARALEGMEPE